MPFPGFWLRSMLGSPTQIVKCKKCYIYLRPERHSYFKFVQLTLLIVIAAMLIISDELFHILQNFSVILLWIILIAISHSVLIFIIWKNEKFIREPDEDKKIIL